MVSKCKTIRASLAKLIDPDYESKEDEPMPAADPEAKEEKAPAEEEEEEEEMEEEGLTGQKGGSDDDDDD